MSRICYGLPILINPDYIGELETETDNFKKKGLHKSAVAALEDLGSQNLNALHRGMGIFPDIGL